MKAIVDTCKFTMKRVTNRKQVIIQFLKKNLFHIFKTNLSLSKEVPSVYLDHIRIMNLYCQCLIKFF